MQSRYIGHFDGQALNDQKAGRAVYEATWLDGEAVDNEGVLYVAPGSPSTQTELLKRARVLPGT